MPMPGARSCQNAPNWSREATPDIGGDRFFCLRRQGVVAEGVMIEGAEGGTGFGHKLAPLLRQFVSDGGLHRAIHRLAASVGTEFRFQRDDDDFDK